MMMLKEKKEKMVQKKFTFMCLKISSIFLQQKQD